MNDRLKSLYQQYRFLMIQANSFYGMCNNQEKIEKNIQMQQKVQKELKKIREEIQNEKGIDPKEVMKS